MDLALILLLKKIEGICLFVYYNGSCHLIKGFCEAKKKKNTPKVFSKTITESDD